MPRWAARALRVECYVAARLASRVATRQRTPVSPLTAAVLFAAFAFATAGWFRDPAAAPPATTEVAGARVSGERDRAAWQPSPVPTRRTVLADPAWREVTFYSQALGREMPYLVWLPPDYDRASARYPVLYLLHGAGDGIAAGRVEWVNVGLAPAVDQLLAWGEIRPMIVVLPEGEQGYWIDHANGGPKWAAYTARDVVRHVDRTFRTDARPGRRAIGGLSMGGHGAVQLALNYPDVFRIAGAHSPSIREYPQSPPFFGNPAWFARYDPIALARQRRGTRGLTVWIDWGVRDRWRAGSEALADALQGSGARVQAHRFDGEHEGGYWRAHLPDYLRFYAQALAGTGA